MIPLSLTSLTSAVLDAALVVGTSSQCPSLQKWTPLEGIPPHPLVDTRERTTASPDKEISEDLSLQTLRVLEHFSFLREVSREEAGLISEETSKGAINAWSECWRETGYGLPIPAACTGPDGQLQYAWDRCQHHLELNFSPLQSPSFFYHNRESGEFWMDDLVPGNLGEAAISKLQLFV